MKTFYKILVVFVLLAVITGCGPKSTQAVPTVIPTATQPQQPAAPVTRPMVIIASDDPGSADPAENWNFGGAAYLPNVYEGLFRFVGSSSPQMEPWLAAEIPTVENKGISSDGLVYTIKLKTNAKFHDGSPVNADAVVYSFQRIEALKKGANGVSADWVKTVEKVDDATVKFTLNQPFADFLNALGSVWGGYIVNPAVTNAHVANNDWGYTYLLDHDAGSGPYVLTSFDHASKTITLDRFANYWGGWQGNNHVEKAIIRWLPDATTARPMIEKGDADVLVNPPVTDFLALKSTPKLVSYQNPSIMQYYVSMNTSVKPLDNLQVRQALQYSFDTDKIIQDIYNGTVLKMNAAVGPGYPDVYPAATQYSYDPQKAKDLLKTAGYASGLTLTVNRTGVPNDQAALELWQADLKAIGVTLNIQDVDAGTWGDAWMNNCTAASAPNIGQISTMQVGGDYPSAWEVMGQVVPVPRLGGGKCSMDYMNDPVVNDTYNKIAATTDPATRKQLFQKLYDALAADAGIIWIGQGNDLVVTRDVVQGYQYYFSMGGNYLPLASMFLLQ
jgi:peptide/nickel transport system substrate-binding protein